MIVQNKLSPKDLPSNLLQKELTKLFALILLKPPSLMDKGVENAAWFLETDKGQFIAKVFTISEVTIAEIKEEVNIYSFLQKNGICAPTILVSLNNNTVEQIEINKVKFPFFIMRYENLKRSYPSSATKKEITQIAKSLAKMHRVLNNYPNLEKIKRKKGYYTHFIPLRAFPTLKKSPNANIFTGEELNNLKVLDNKMVSFYKKNKPKFQLTETVIHGDIALEHVQFLENGKLYFFDFSDYFYGPVSHEIAVFLTHLHREENITIKRWEELKQWVIEGYRSITKLTDNDYKAIKPFIIRRLLGEILYLSAISNKINKEVDSMGIKRRYILADYLLN